MGRRAERFGFKSDELLASKSNVLLEVIRSPGCVHFTILSMLKHSMKETNIILFFICPAFAPPEFGEISFLHHLFLLLDTALFKSLLACT